MPQARTADGMVVWILSVLLAIVFLLAGIPKLIGIAPLALQAAAMQGFPAWIRVLVGLMEVIGAIALLFPRVATLAALLLALLMVPATITQHLSTQGGTWVPLLLLVLLLFVAWRRSAVVVHDVYRAFLEHPHHGLRNGVVAGLIGATVIAVWFLVVDSIAGHPFFTPATLGHGLLNAIGFGPETYGLTTDVLVYTAFHFAAFMLVGLTASLVVYMARYQPSILFAFVLLFAVTEVGIYMLVSILDVASPLGRNAWLQIMVGNVIAALAMGTYFWSRHRHLGEHFRRSLDWDAPDLTRPTDTNVAESAGYARA